MPFLGGSEIIGRKKELFEEGFFDDSQVHQSSYDLRLGEEFYISGSAAPGSLSTRKPYLTLKPGQFAILTCHEKLDLAQNVIGLITLRNRFKMQGLVNVSGFHVDPTFKGRLVFAVQNVGPNDIRLRHMDPTFTIFFAEVRSPKDEKRPTRRGIELDDVRQLGGSSITLAKLQKQVSTLRTLLLIYGSFAVALLIALIVNILRSTNAGNHYH